MVCNKTSMRYCTTRAGRESIDFDAEITGFLKSHDAQQPRKGASGAAVQSLNLMAGPPEAAGLNL